MKITLKSSPNRFNFPFRIIGNAGRYDTISDCEFVDDTHIICVDRQMACIYLIQFDLDKNTYSILDSVTCICNKVPVHFELISIHRNILTRITTIYSISYDNRLFSCILKGNKFHDCKTRIVNTHDSYHGVLALEDGESVYVTNMKQPTITKFNTRTGIKQTIVCCGGTRMKDVAVIDIDHIIALSSDKGPTNGIQKPDGHVYPICKPYDSHVFLYDCNTGQQLSVHTLKDTQIDGCVYNAPYCFVTCANSSGVGYILRLSVNLTEYIFTDCVQFPCEGFPHGICVYNNKLAYTSYSKSSVYIHDLAEFI